LTQIKDSILVIESGIGDTLDLDNFQDFHFVGPYYERDLGNLGSTKYSLFAQHRNYTPFYSSFFDSNRDLPFYVANKPVSSATYQLATNKGQQFDVFHAQPLKSSLLLNLAFHKIRSEGFYNHQINDIKRIRLGLQIHPARSRYYGRINGQFSDILRQENGGLDDDSLWSLGTYQNNRLYQVYFTDGIGKKTNWNLNVFQSYLVQKQDSLSTKLNFGFWHEFNYHYGDYRYTGDPLNGYFSNVYLDSLNTQDRSFAEHLIQKGGFRIKSKRMDILFGVGYSKVNYGNLDIDTSAQLMSALFKGDYNLGALKIFWDGMYQFSGPQSSDYSFLFRGRRAFKWNGLSTAIELKADKNHPYLNQQFYVSNHFQWSSNFQQFQRLQIQLDGNLDSLKLNVSAFYLNTQKGIYFNENGIPLQFNETASVFGLRIEKSTRIFRGLHLDTRVIYQFTEENPIYLIPQWVAYASAYFKGKAWSMDLNIGANVNYFSSYNAPVYLPALNSFGIQNGNKFGNYPMVGVFMEGRVRTVRYYLALDHVLEGVLERNYFAFPGYPMVDRLFRFGLSWTFIN
jgi:hypothetical protein